MLSIADDAAIVSAAALILGAIFVLIELRHMQKVRNVEISMKLFEWAQTERLLKAFRYIENEFRFEDYQKHKKRKGSFEVTDYLQEAAGFFEQVGFLVEKKFVDLDVIDDRLGSHIISSWKKLGPWIMAVRNHGCDKNFGEHFEKLYERTAKYMRER